MQNKALKIIGIVFFVFVLFLTFFSNQIYNMSIPSVSVKMASEGNIRRLLDTTGNVTFGLEKDISIDFSTQIKEINVLEGVSVKKGQLLFKADTKLLNEKINEITNSIAKMELYDKNTMLDIENMEHKIATLEQQIKKASGDLAQTLLNEKNEYTYSVEKDKNTLQISAIEKENLVNLQSNLQQESATKGEFYAENDCVVSKINFNVGAFVNQGSSVMTVNILNDKQAEFTIEKEISFVKEGDTVILTVQSLKNPTTMGKVKSISPNGNVNKMLVSFNTNETLHGGEPVMLHYSKEIKTNGYLLPNNAVYNVSGKYFIYMINTQKGSFGTEYYVTKQNINYIDSDDNNTAFTADSIPDNPVIVNSSTFLYDNLRVKLIDGSDLYEKK